MTSSVSFDVWSSVEVLYKSPCLSDPKEARFVFFPELHNREDMRRVHAAFINAVAQPKTCLLVEGHKAGVILEHERKKRIVNEYLIPESAEEQLTVMGWDYYGEDLEETRASCLEKRASIKLLMESISSPEIESDQEKKIELRNLIKKKIEELKEEEFWLSGEHAAETIKDPRYLDRFSTERQLYIAIAVSEIVKLKGMPSNPLHAENIHRIEELERKLLYVDFEKRTKAMVEVLHSLKVRSVYDRVFLIAGETHIIESPRADDDGRLKLTSLHRFLLTSKAIIVRRKESV